MNNVTKGNSPFNPSAPVSAELFVGRKEQIRRIRERGIAQVERGKPIAVFIEGEFGIGKSSMARFAQRVAQEEHHLLGIYVTLYGAETVEEMVESVVETTLKTAVSNTRFSDRVRNLVDRYVKDVSLFGVTLNVDALRRDAPKSPVGLLSFFERLLQSLRPEGTKGIVFVLDEINGITRNPKFARFVKSFWESNNLMENPVPLLFMLCGVEERRGEMIRCHSPVDRIFDVIPIDPLNEEEAREFFLRAFESVKIEVDPGALEVFTHWSGGLPRIMHVIGDEAYWLDSDGVISQEEAKRAIVNAAEVVGKKYVEQQLYKALRSKDYVEILSKIARPEPKLQQSFFRSEVEPRLTKEERKKFGNFLQRMKKLNVLRSGEHRGEYVFNIRMVPVYAWLQSERRRREEKGA